MKRSTLIWMIAVLSFLFLNGCASSDAPADKETHVIPQQTTGPINLTVPSPPVAEEKPVPTIHNYFYGPLVSIKQEMKIDDAALKGGDMSTEGGQAEQRTDPSTTIPVAQQGGQINLESQTEGAKATQDNRVDKKKTNSENTEVVAPIPVLQPDGTKTPVNDNDNVGDGTVEPIVGSYPFHHTQLNGGDKDKVTGKGVSLVLCPGDDEKDFKCSQGDVNIPFHGSDPKDEVPRMSYWNMKDSSTGSIKCTKDGNIYFFQTTEGKIHDGSCE